MKTERKELMRVLKDLEGNCDHLDKLIWDLEMEHSRIHEETEKNIREYNETARKLKLIPATAENANGFDFEMHFNPQPPGIGEHFKDELKPNLIKLKERITERTRNLQTQIITADEAIDQMLDIINDKQEQVEALESKQAVFDQEMELKKEEMTKQHQQALADIQEQEARIANKKKEVQESGKKKQLQLLKSQQKATRRVSELNEEVQEFKQFLVNVCHVVMEHKTIISKSVKEIEEKATEALEERELPCTSTYCR